MTASTESLLREDVSPESVWNKELVYDSWDAWEADYELALAELPKLVEFKGRLGDGPETLLSWFEAYVEQWDREVKLMVYAGMAASVDSSDTEAKAHEGQVLGLWSERLATTAFVAPELTAIAEELLRWTREEPALRQYRHYFEELVRMARHQRSAEVEEVLGLLRQSFYGVVSTARELTNTDLTFADAVDSKGNSHSVHQATLPPSGIKSPDRERRRTAWESFYDAHLGMQNTLASNYTTRVKQMVALARIRGYDSVLEMRLAPEDIPVALFHNVMDTFQAQLPVWHRYWEVRRQVLGVEALHPYDIWAPLGQEEPVIPYRQGVEWLCEALAPLGKPYVALLRRACLEEGWVDYAPNREKDQGAGAFWPAPELPAFVHTSYEGSAGCLSVLAHELGHALHFTVFSNEQPQVYRDYETLSSVVSETASNFHQAMLRAYLHRVKSNDRAFRLALLDETLFNFHRYFFVMPILSQFELEVYRRAEKNQPLTAPILNEIMGGLFAQGYGETMADDPERTQITWAQFAHLYRPFYPFQYAVGIAAAHALADRVLNEGGEAAGRYLQFLRAGSSVSPVAAFELAGVDMTTPEPVEKAFAALSADIDRLAEVAA